MSQTYAIVCRWCNWPIRSQSDQCPSRRPAGTCEHDPEVNQAEAMRNIGHDCGFCGGEGFAEEGDTEMDDFPECVYCDGTGIAQTPWWVKSEPEDNGSSLEPDDG